MAEPVPQSLGRRGAPSPERYPKDLLATVQADPIHLRYLFRYFQLAADDGDSHAQFTLGLCYEDGVAVKQDDHLAIEYFKRAAQARHPGAQFYLGLHYSQGVGLSRNDETAMFYFKQAADQGHAKAQFHLGLLYENGLGVMKDGKTAFAYYQVAAQKGFIPALNNLGSCYANGVGIVKDEKIAMICHQLARADPHDRSQTNGEVPPNVVDAAYLPPENYPKNTQSLQILQRLARRSSSLPQDSCGTSGAVYLAKTLPDAHQITLRVIYSYNPEKDIETLHTEEIKIHSFLCSLKGSRRFILQFYTSWVERVHPSRFPDWDADMSLTNNRSLFMAMEFVPWNLEQFRNLFRLTEADVLLIAFQIAMGISFLQKHHIVHRDIKPENILIDELGRPLIFDFGSALRFVPEDNLNSPYPVDGIPKGGTFLYLPPEIRTQRPGENVLINYATCDSYALGITIYVLFRLEPPYDFVRPPLIPNCTCMLQTVVSAMVSADLLSRLRIQGIIEALRMAVSVMWQNISDKLKQNPILSEIRMVSEALEAQYEPHDISRVHELMRKSKEGDIRAQVKLGIRFLDGEGVRKNEIMAFQYFQIAGLQQTQKPVPEAQHMLGSCYANGIGVSRDEYLAAQFYQLAADRGLAQAQFDMGVCYVNGRGVIRDETLAVKYYKLAAEQGIAGAQFDLGICFASGVGVRKNERLACKYFDQAAEQGITNEVHFDLEIRSPDISSYKNPMMAVQYFQSAAEEGLPEAVSNLGICYFNGLGLPQDIKTAIEHFKTAAEAGVAEAQFNLGNCYATGVGVFQHDTMAFKFYKQASEQGHIRAQFNVGVCFGNGIGVSKQQTIAFHFFGLAAHHGHVRATFHVGFSYCNGKGVPIDEARGFKCIEFAANKGDVDALFTLGLCYSQGIGVKRADEKKAVKYYRLAADRGHPLSSFKRYAPEYPHIIQTPMEITPVAIDPHAHVPCLIPESLIPTTAQPVAVPIGENVIFSLRSWEQLGDIVYQRFTPENAVVVPPERDLSSEEEWVKRHRRPIGRPEDEMILEENPDSQGGDDRYILRPDPDKKNRPQYPTRKRIRSCAEKDHCWEYMQFWRCGDQHSREELDFMNTFRVSHHQPQTHNSSTQPLSFLVIRGNRSFSIRFHARSILYSKKPILYSLSGVHEN